jgi:hypothetical protein
LLMRIHPQSTRIRRHFSIKISSSPRRPQTDFLCRSSNQKHLRLLAQLIFIELFGSWYMMGAKCITKRKRYPTSLLSGLLETSNSVSVLSESPSIAISSRPRITFARRHNTNATPLSPRDFHHAAVPASSGSGYHEVSKPLI